MRNISLLLNKNYINCIKWSGFWWTKLNVSDGFKTQCTGCWDQKKFSCESLGAVLDFTNLTSPHTWYPVARGIRRKVTIHVGPTNSGKTHAALQELQKAESGLYCGPLRLLAWQVAESLNQRGTPCSLITGQERRQVAASRHTASTVEMADVSREYECGVIDEIQLIGSSDRGSSFTRALLGLPVRELHVCGNSAGAHLVQVLLASTTDEVEVKSYERLSPLVPSHRALQSYSRVKRGDCVVAFSRKDIYKIKSEIEATTNKKCRVVYGSLPPETRARQAEQFNDPASEFEVLVASDAVAMGLNLNIRRVVLSTMEKFDGSRVRKLTHEEVKQIAGRAGRYASTFPDGEVT